MAKIMIKVRGTSPLLTHNPASMSNGSSGPSKGKNIPTPAVEAEAGTYRLEDGQCAIPGIGFRNGIVSAASAWKKGKTFMSSALAHIQVEEELVPLFEEDGTPIKSYRIDIRRAIVVKSGILRSRPRFDSWHATFTIDYEEEMTNEQMILDICADAGKRMGVGDYRPQKKGWFGRYEIIRD